MRASRGGLPRGRRPVLRSSSVVRNVHTQIFLSLCAYSPSSLLPGERKHVPFLGCFFFLLPELLKRCKHRAGNVCEWHSNVDT